MRVFLQFIFLINLLAGFGAFAAITKPLDADSMDRKVKELVHDVDVIRRDQVNYKIEKDLLEKAYSSNIQTINMIITIVLGVLGVLGYLGIRSIKEIKSDYSSELEKLRSLKIQLETEIEALRSKQKEFEGQVGSLAKTNEEQDRRLKVMELIEKISTLTSNKQWQWAIKYADIGLGIDSKNTILLSQKSICHAKQGDLILAIEAAKSVILIEPENSSQAFNLLEFYALSNQPDEFNKIYSTYKISVDLEHEGALVVYLQSMLDIMSDNLESARTRLHNFASNQDSIAKEFLDSWSFDEAKLIISKIKDGDQKRLANLLILFFDGKISPPDFVETLNVG